MMSKYHNLNFKENYFQIKQSSSVLSLKAPSSFEANVELHCPKENKNQETVAEPQSLHFPKR